MVGDSAERRTPDHARERLARRQARTVAAVLESAGGTERSDPRKVRASEMSFGRKSAKTVGCQRGASVWTGRDTSRGRGAGDEYQDGPGREAGTGEGTQPSGAWEGPRARAPTRRGTEIGSGEASGIALGDRADRGPGHARGPDGSAPVGFEKLASHRERAEPARLFGQHQHGKQGVAGGAEIQPARFAQDPGRDFASRSGRPVPLYQPAVPGVPTARSAGDFG